MGCTMSKCRDFLSKEAAKVIVNDEKRRWQQQRERGEVGLPVVLLSSGRKKSTQLEI